MVVAQSLSVEPMTPVVGAVISGIEIGHPLDEDTRRAVRQAVLDHGVVFFRDQDVTRDQLLEFMANFGTPRADPFSVDRPVPASEHVVDMHTLAYRRATSVWHIDSSLAPEPASLISLRALEVPPVGGDTCWSSMYAAYQTLSPPLQAFLDGLTAVHSAFKVMKLMAGAGYGALQEDMVSVHPVVRLHPETGRKALFVDELWTERVVELEAAESAHLLTFLFEHVKSPNLMIRWHWRRNDVALWDNRAFQHYAVGDYEATRIMQKTILAGDRPFGPT